MLFLHVFDALHSLYCADVPLRYCSLTHSLYIFDDHYISIDAD